MDSDYTYQSQYIWKSTHKDGLLPVTNYTEEIKDQEKRKGGGGATGAGQGREIGVITNFEDQDDEDEAAGEEEGGKERSMVPG